MSKHQFKVVHQPFGSQEDVVNYMNEQGENGWEPMTYDIQEEHHKGEYSGEPYAYTKYWLKAQFKREVKLQIPLRPGDVADTTNWLTYS